MSRRRRDAPSAGRPSTAAPDRIRLDKWLWFARFFKTRAIAAAFVEGGKVRVNGTRTAKPGHALKEGDVLTFVRAGAPIVVEVAACGARRGPSVEAMTLYRRLDGASTASVGGETATDDRTPADRSAAPPPETSRRGDLEEQSPSP